MKRKKIQTIADYAKLWVLAGPSPETVTRRRNGIRPIVEDFGDRPIDGGVTDPEARSWAPRHPGNVRYAKGLFAAAVEDGLTSRDPFRRCKQVRSNRAVVVPSVAELRRAVDAAGELEVYGREFRAAILLACGTGLRVAELCKLEARDVVEVPDLRVQVRDGKGGVHRQALVLEPFGGDLVAEALRGMLRRRSPYVAEATMPRVGRIWLRPPARGASPKDSPYLDRYEVKRLWAGDGRGRAGLRDAVGLGSCRWHDLRHFHATWLLDRGCTAEDVAVQLFGHPDPTLVIRTYGHPNAELARERMRRRAEGS